MVVLTGESIRIRCVGDKPLVTNTIDLETQIQQNGIDLTLKKVELFEGGGIVDFDNSKRSLPEVRQLSVCQYDLDGKAFYDLPQGVYLVTFNEIVNIPKTLMCWARPRSTLMRCGATIHTAI
jgi:dUTP pyrophosphatase